VVRRRALLGAAALLAGCGSEAAPAPRADEQQGGDSSLADVALLDDALAAERRTAGVLPRAAAHVAALERAIARAGGEARPDAGGAQAGDAEAAAGELVAFYVDLLAKVADPRLRELVAGMLSDAATALATAREMPAPHAFEEGRRPA
jgi:hypothetical protein